MLIKNKKATFDYTVVDEIEAGIVLTGNEIKSIRQGHVQLKDSFAQLKNGEVFLINAHISPYEHANTFDKVNPLRTRKLLLHKKQIKKWEKELKLKGFTLIPLNMHMTNGKVKVQLALAKGKHTYDKRQSIKERDIARDNARY